MLIVCSVQALRRVWSDRKEATMPVPKNYASESQPRFPWNKGRLMGQKRPLKPKDVWAIRVRLQLEGCKRDLALFNLTIDSKLRGCDLVSLQLDDVSVGGGAGSRHRDPEEDRQAGPVRDYRADASLDPRLGVGRKSQERGLPIAELPSRAVAPFDAPIRPHRTCLGRERRARQLGLRHPLDAPDEGGADLSKDRQLASGPAASWAYEAGEHGSLSRN